jgi:hypothetical protein
MTLLKHEPSAQMPWQNTMAGLIFVDILVLLIDRALRLVRFRNGAVSMRRPLGF